MCAAEQTESKTQSRYAILYCHTLLHTAVEVPCQHAHAVPRQSKSFDSFASLRLALASLTAALVAVQGESCSQS